MLQIYHKNYLNLEAVKAIAQRTNNWILWLIYYYSLNILRIRHHRLSTLPTFVVASWEFHRIELSVSTGMVKNIYQTFRTKFSHEIIYDFLIYTNCDMSQATPLFIVVCYPPSICYLYITVSFVEKLNKRLSCFHVNWYWYCATDFLFRTIFYFTHSVRLSILCFIENLFWCQVLFFFQVGITHFVRDRSDVLFQK